MSDILKYIAPCDVNADYIIVSYSSKDKEQVWKDVYELQNRGYNVWLDEKNLDKTKKSWKDDALKAIEDINCQLLIFYVSQYSLCSKACYDEVMHTTSERTVETHFSNVKVIVVETELINNLGIYCTNLRNRLKKSQLSKEEKVFQIKILYRFFHDFFQENNERIRVRPYSNNTDRNNYYSNLISSFPEEVQLGAMERIYAEYSKTDNKYKIFISYGSLKCDQEYKLAKELTEQLKKKNMAVFWPCIPLIGNGADQYKELLDKALAQSSALVVICTTEGGIHMNWTQYIWESYSTEICHEKKRGAVFIYSEEIKRDMLPEMLKSAEIVDQNTRSISEFADYIWKELKNAASIINTDHIPLESNEQKNIKTNPVNQLLKFANLVSCGDSSGKYVNPYVSKEMADIIATHIGRIKPYNTEKCMERGLNPVQYEIFLAQKIARINKPESCSKAYYLLHNVPNSWTVFLNEEDKIVAYWIFVALKEDAYHLVSSGRVDEKDISIEDIRFIDMPGNYKGYLLLSGAIEHCRTPKVVNKLYDSWIKYIEKLAKQEIFFDEISSMVGSRAGNSSLHNIGMTYFSEYVSGGKMYKYDLTDITSIPFLYKNYPRLCELYKKAYRKDI